MTDFSTIRQLSAFVSTRPLVFGELEQIEAVRAIECAESLLGERVECTKCEGWGSCTQCDAACSECRSNGAFIVDRERIENLTVAQVRRFTAQIFSRRTLAA